MLRRQARGPLETVADAERRARKRLPRPVYTSLLAGSEKGLTLHDNVAAFDEIGLLPRVGSDVPPVRDLATTILGQKITMPVLIAPVGAQAVDPGGEVPAARAAAEAGIAIIQSSFASRPFAQVSAANPKAMLQLYWIGSRDQMAEYVERAREDGAHALVLTMDIVPGPAFRDWGTPHLPASLDLAELIRYAPAGLSRPGWMLRFVMHGGLPSLTLPNLATSTTPAPSFLGGREMMLRTGQPTWGDVAWLREIWGGPFMVKGVMHPDDARRAVDAGATAISVSNHGGNNLDSTPSALRALPGVARAVGDQVEITYDGGVRRGGDIAKALALGARAVLIGRPWVFGLAARGERGVSEILESMRVGLDKVVAGLGHATAQELSPADLIVPENFAIRDTK